MRRNKLLTRTGIAALMLLGLSVVAAFGWSDTTQAQKHTKSHAHKQKIVI